MYKEQEILNPKSSIELGPTFLGLQAHQLLSVIDQQGTSLLAAHGIDLPSRAVSTLMYLKKSRHVTVTGLAQFLGMSHQLVRHRLKDLKARKLITEKRDSTDLRRTRISLTKTGKELVLKVESLNKEVERVYLDMFEEIGVDLFAALIKARRALTEKALVTRVLEHRHSAG